MLVWQDLERGLDNGGNQLVNRCAAVPYQVLDLLLVLVVVVVHVVLGLLLSSRSTTSTTSSSYY